MPITGFVKSLNLQESGPVSDETILENLGGAGITEDIRLFAGNLAAKTVIKYGEANVDDNEVYWEYDSDNWIYIKRKTVNEGTVPFSNRTRLIVNNVNYYVFDSDAFTRFKLYDNINADNVIDPSTLDENDLIRRDTVTFQNLDNMSKDRLETITDGGGGAGGDGETDIVSTDDGVEGFLTEVRTIGENYNLGQNAQALFFYKKSRIPRTYEESIFSKRIVFDGSLRITNNDDIPITQDGDPNPNAPGLYIVSGSSSKRAFSDTSNPWNVTLVGASNGNGASLSTDATRIEVANLVVQDPNFRNPNPATFGVVTESGSLATGTTRKLKALINGEVYYLILKE